MTSPSTSSPSQPEPARSAAPPLPASEPASLTDIGVRLGRLNQEIADVSRKLDKKPSRWEQVAAFILAVVLAGAGAYFTAYFTARDIGRNTRATEVARKNVETYDHTVRLLVDVEVGFEAFVVSKGKEDKSVDVRAQQLQKLIQSNALGGATPALDAFNDYVHQRKAELQRQPSSWKKLETEAMQREAKELHAAALKALSDWLIAGR